MRIQTITLNNGMEVIIDHDSKEKCPHCKKEILYVLLPVELVSLAQWDVHKCKEVKNG